jgi:hypothetical protein
MTGKTVYMVDFCWDDLEWMKQVIGQSEAFLLLDHHQTGIPLVTTDVLNDVIDNAQYFCKEESMEELTFHVNFGIDALEPGVKMLCVDQNHSAAVMAGLYTGLIKSPVWDVDEEHEWLYYVEDRDIWRWNLPYAREVTSAIDIFHYNVDDYDRLDGTNWHKLRDDGIAINEYKRQQVELTLPYAQPIEIAGLKMIGAPSSYSLGSDVAHELAKRSPSGIGVYWVDHPTFRKFGLRSLEDGPNVAEICKLYGGNGHIHAAGFSVPNRVECPKLPLRPGVPVNW